MGVEYLVCDECGCTFCDCGEYHYCENCNKVYCVDCEEDAGLEFDEDGCTVSCKYCRNEAVSEDDMLYYLLDKLQITKENLEKEIIETRKKETK